MSYCPPLKPVVLSEKEILIRKLKSQLKLDRETDGKMTSDRLSRILAVAKLTGNPIDAQRVYTPKYGPSLVNEAEILSINLWISVLA